MQSRRDFLKVLGVGSCGFALSGCFHKLELQSQTYRPNFLFILTDDQGWQDVGCFGHPYLRTPNLDKLAEEGIRFEQFYSSSPICSPSRAAFLTGHYPARHCIHFPLSNNHQRNLKRGMPDWLDPKVQTVTRLLQQNGYQIGHFGKWHLGHVNKAPTPGAYAINDHRTFGGYGPGWDVNGNHRATDLAHDELLKGKSPFSTYSTDYFVDEAIRFLERNKNRPFYLNLWTLHPHVPLTPSPEQLAEYNDLKIDPQKFHSWMHQYVTKAEGLDMQMKIYMAAVTALDKSLGRLLDKLDALGLAEKTLVFFTSDNGPEDYHIKNARNSGMGSTGVFRGRKRSLYEGGIRMPCIARWPPRIPNGRIDQTSVIGAVDWLPTVCRLAGIRVPSIKLDGEDISDILQGNKRARQKPLFWECRDNVVGNRAYKSPRLVIRYGNWKLLMNPNSSRKELYNLLEDPGERRNVARLHPEIVARLSLKLIQWEKGLPGVEDCIPS